MAATSLKVEARDEKLTKSEVKKLRSEGKVPGVVYGKKVGALTIAVDTKELLSLLRSNPKAIVEMDLPQNGKQPVMIHEIQRDKVNRSLLHIDFHQINMDEPVRTSVPLDFVGDSTGVREGGMLQIQMHELEIRCLPHLIPSSIAVDVTALDLGGTVLVGDITVPAGIEIKADPGDVVVTVLAPQKEVVEEVEAVEVEEPKAEKTAEAAAEAETVS